MVEEPRRGLAAKQPRQPELDGRRVHEVAPADDEVDPMPASSTTTHHVYVQLPTRSRTSGRRRRGLIGSGPRGGPPSARSPRPRRRAARRRHPRRARAAARARAADSAPRPARDASYAANVERAQVHAYTRPWSRSGCERGGVHALVVRLAERRRTRAEGRDRQARPGRRPAARGPQDAASNSGRDRCRSWSSMRSTTRPPVARAIPQT